MCSKEIVKITLPNCSLDEQTILTYKGRVREIHSHILQQNSTGWIDFPIQNNESLLDSINYIASEIKACADVLVVIGVGGSF